MTHPSFADLGVPTDLVERLAADGITEAFPIQASTLPDALRGADVCGRAPTGSGKTLAFAVPLATRTERARSRHPRALVLVPTRELASQVRDTVQPLAERRQRRVATFYGGTNIRRDQQRLQRGVDIAVATPGRLADLVRRGDCHLGDVSLVVIDEADRMADMGFLPEVTRLLDQTADDRQTLLFSATLDGDVDALIRRYQHDPARHEVASSQEDRGDIRHVFWPAEREDRRRLTADVVREHGPAIVFTRTKHGADRLAKQLAKDGIRTATIHGNRSQRQRERALAQFSEGSITALVATDVAARGIHVDNVAVVVHYDMPGTHKDYVHRSGRTGRAGADGIVVSLIAHAERKALGDLQRTLDLPRGLHRQHLEVLGGDEAPTPLREGASGGKSAGNGSATKGGRSRTQNGRSRKGGKRSRNGGQSRNGGSPKGGSSKGGSGKPRHAGGPRGGARSPQRRSA